MHESVIVCVSTLLSRILTILVRKSQSHHESLKNRQNVYNISKNLVRENMVVVKACKAISLLATAAAAVYTIIYIVKMIMHMVLKCNVNSKINP